MIEQRKEDAEVNDRVPRITFAWPSSLLLLFFNRFKGRMSVGCACVFLFLGTFRFIPIAPFPLVLLFLLVVPLLPLRLHHHLSLVCRQKTKYSTCKLDTAKGRP